MPAPKVSAILNRVVLISALGYFVDIYDLLLFSIVRVPSLTALGVPASDHLDTGVLILNWQMGGLLLGGILWGVLGDKRGRLYVLFGSILLYSVANLANAYLPEIADAMGGGRVEWYAGLRFVAGIGLAGELGAAVTLVSETMTKETRGYGTAVVAGVGILGAVAANLVGRFTDWQTAYLIGGLLGLVLLVARFTLVDSGLYRALDRRVRRGDFVLLLSTRERAGRYFYSLLVGMPLWFVVGILITFSPELAGPLHVGGPTGTVAAGDAVMWCYLGLTAGDFGSGFLSGYLRSRKSVLVMFLALTSALMYVYVAQDGWSVPGFYALCFGLGVGAGYWAVFITNAAEQFGTNLRATVATTAPNFVRGSVIPLTIAFRFLADHVGLLMSAMIVGQASVLVALFAVRKLRETYGKDLDYVEGAPDLERRAPATTPS